VTEAHHLCVCGARFDQHTAPYWNDPKTGRPTCATGEPISHGTEGAKCLRFTLAAVPLPAGCAPDPLDQAAVRVLPDATAAAAEVDSHMVPLGVAKRIRDEAVADLTAIRNQAAIDVNAIHDDHVANLKSELDGAHQTIADTARAIARHLPTGDDQYPSITAAIKAVHEHAYAQGAADAVATVAAAIEDEPGTETS
jgi:hypothetical protein